MSTLLVYLNPGSLSAEQYDEISNAIPEMKLLITTEEEEVAKVYDDIEIVAGWYPGERILRAPNLRWYQQWGAGANWLMGFHGADKLSIIVTNVSGLHAVSMGEHILGMLLIFARKFNHSFKNQSNLKWMPPKENEILELSGKTLLLVGLGSIGAHAARLASAMGMKVVGIRRNPSVKSECVDAVYSPNHLLEILPNVDFVVLTIPLTHATKGLVGEKELRAMKSSACIFNVGRGGTIQEDALRRALQEKWIAGAGLDVFEEEPLPKDSPFWKMDNVVITAHYAGLTPNYDSQAFDIFIENLKRYISGKQLKNIVDKNLGY